MKEEALKLADELQKHFNCYNEYSDMIRRLVEELDKQTKPTITKLDGKVVAVTMTDDEHRITEVLWEAPKPLSDEEIKELSELTSDPDPTSFVRAIEERHGIK